MINSTNWNFEERIFNEELNDDFPDFDLEDQDWIYPVSEWQDMLSEQVWCDDWGHGYWEDIDGNELEGDIFDYKNPPKNAHHVNWYNK